MTGPVTDTTSPDEKRRPTRIQLRRTKGWRKPEGAVVVARPTKWGNPWRIGDPSPWDPYQPMDASGAVATFRYGIDTPVGRVSVTVLRGYDLACWCRLDAPCHADVLLALANPEVPS